GNCRVCAEASGRAWRKGTAGWRDERSSIAAGRGYAAGQRANNYIEELSLGPGVERTLRVRYCPASPAPVAGGAVGNPDEDADETATGGGAKNASAPAKSSRGTTNT
ncbi:unnamed protein product, partial [Ectocarpus sp. 12 AP-2014]